MATAALRRAMTAFTRPPDPSDADLLRQFADGRCEAAFAALVRRHGPLVLGVCRRVVPDRHLADDAFQAAFVVLARRAGGLDSSRPLGPWLYGVAHRVALRARTMLGKRRKRETLTAAVPEVARHSPEVDDTATILDEEIAKLPDATRDAVILCELQGLSRKDAAARLGIAEGTLSSRLASARKTLAAKLQARGVVLSIALASAVVSADLVAATVAAGTGVSLTSVVVSLADGASAMTLLNKLKLTAVAVLFTLLSVGGFGPWRANETSAAPVPKAKDAGGLIWVANHTAGTLTGYKSDGTAASVQPLPGGGRFLGVTPFGLVAFAGKKGKPVDGGAAEGLTVHLRQIAETADATDTGMPWASGDGLVWSPDGRQVVRTRVTINNPAKNGSTQFAHTLIDVPTGKEKPLELPAHHRLTGWSPDGTWWLVAEADGESHRMHRHPVAGGKPTRLGDDFRFTLVGAVAPSGESVALFGAGKWNETTGATVAVAPAAGGGGKVVVKNPTAIAANGSWSPDGERLAFLTVEDPSDAGGRNPWVKRLTVCDPDGGNAVVLHTWENTDGDDGFARIFTCTWLPTREPIKAPVPKVKQDAGMIWTHDLKANELIGYTPGGDEGERLKLPQQQAFVGVTPDGASILYSAMAKGAGKQTYHLRPFGADTAGTDTGIDVSTLDGLVCWSGDGTRFVRVRRDNPLRPAVGVKFPVVGYEVVDLAAKTITPVHTPADTYVLGWTPDEKQFVGNRVAMGKDDLRGVCLFSVVPASEVWRAKVSFLDMEDVSPLSLTPAGDGKTLMGGGWKLADDKPYHAVYRFDPAGKVTELFHAAGQNMTQAVPSPDGKRYAAVWIDYGTPVDEPSVRRLTVADADGRGAVTVTLRGVGIDLGLLRLVGWFPAPPKAKPPVKEPIKAPVPKAKPRDGVIMVATNSQPAQVRLYTPDGKLLRELSVETASDCTLSPDGTRVAVCVKDDTVKGESYDVYLVDAAGGGKELGEPLARGFYLPRTAWAPDGKTLYVSTFDPPPADSNTLQPGAVTVCDVAKKTAAVNDSLRGFIVLAVSANGERLLTGREDGRNRKWRNELLDRATLKPVDLGDHGVNILNRNLFADDTLVGLRPKPDGPADIREFVFFDVKAKEVRPVPLPKEVTGESACVLSVHLAPDGRRMLVFWDEETDKPADWQGKAPCRLRRLTVCDRDGTNAKTILRQEVKSADDYFKTQFAWLDWR